MLLSGLSNTSSSSSNAASQAAQDQKQLNEDLNQFLNLLTTQLQHQDPLDPMDANEFTSQLVQFASVEQQIYSNANLEELVNLQEVNQVSFMVDYLGTTVEAAGKTFYREGSDPTKATYTLGADAKETLISIINEDGDVVYSETGETEMGFHEFQWDGKDKNGMQVPDGVYSINVSALDFEDEPINLFQTVYSRVTGAGAEDGEVVLYSNDVAIPMESILAVNENPSGSSNSGGDTSGDDTSGDDTSGDDTSGDDTSGDDTSGDDTSGDETTDETVE